MMATPAPDAHLPQAHTVLAFGARECRGVQARSTHLRVAQKGMMMAGKYTPLEKYLRDIPANQNEVTLSFEQIERIINTKLPSSAYGYLQWWEHEKEGNHVNARAWANAGWKVEEVDFKKKQARLVRG